MAQRVEGRLDIVDSDGRRVFEFDADNRRITAWDEENREVLRFYGRNGQLYVGGEGNEGDFFVTDGAGRNFLRVDSGAHRVYVDDGGGRDFLRVEAGEHRFFGHDGQGRRVLTFFGSNAQLYVGGEGNEGDLYVVHPSGTNTIQLDGNSGDIILRNADAAEEFDVAAGQQIEAGTVVVVDDAGSVRACDEPYDRRVAGIVSGAGDYRPGLVLDSRDGRARVPVALMGKASCRVDARHEPVAVGDLLTTSGTPGHAMRAADDGRTTGAVIGKALRPLTDRSGLVPVLVALQ